jgi:thiol peroxidase
MATAKKSKTKAKPAKKAPAKSAKKPVLKAQPASKKIASVKLMRIKGPTERVGLIEVGGKPATVVGDDIVVGQSAPEFTVQANDWSEFRGLTDTQGKVRIISAVLSLSTDVCDRETRKFNERASELSDELVILTISPDLPPTQKNWCGAAGVDRVKTLSDHMDTNFAIKYGTLIKERRWNRRAVFVVDKNDKVTYVAYMPALGMEPNYDEVLAAAKAAL